MKSRWFMGTGLALTGAAFCLIVWMSGCTAKALLPVSVFFPVTPTPVPTCGILFNGCESLTQNGNWTGTNATRALSTSHATQGSYSIQAMFNIYSGWNDQFLILDSFTPSDWSSYNKLVADVYIDPQLLAGSTWAKLLISADAGTMGVYYRYISNTTVTPVAGQQTATWALDNMSVLPAGAPITKVTFILQTDGIGGTGSNSCIYFDNIRLVAPCGTPTPQPTPTPPCGVLVNSWETLTENGSLTLANMANASPSISSLHAVMGMNTLDLNITGAFTWNDHFFYWAGFTPVVWSTYTTLQADVYVDPSIVANIGWTPQLRLYGDAVGYLGQSIAAEASMPGLVAGAQHVIWTLSWTSIPAGTPLTGISFVINRSGPLSGTDGTGHFYLDNLRLCP